MTNPTLGPNGTSLLDDFTRSGAVSPAFVTNSGVAGSTTAAATLPITVASGHVPSVGNHLIAHWAGTNPLTSITDSRNTWQLDVSDPTGSSPGLASCYIANSYTIGDVITAHCSSGKNRVLGIDEFSGLDPIDWFVFNATTKNATSAAPSTNSIRAGSLALTYASYGATTVPTGTPFTSGASFTSVTDATNVFGSFGQYNIGTGGGGVSGTGTFGSSVIWRGIEAIYASKYSLDTTKWRTPAPITSFTGNKYVINSPTTVGLIVTLQTGGPNGSAYWAPLLGNDQEIWGQVSSAGDNPVLGTLLDPSGSPTGGYFLSYGSGSIGLFRNGQTSGLLASGTKTLASGDWWALSSVGGLHTCSTWNGSVWTTLFTFTDTTYTSGHIYCASLGGGNGAHLAIGGGSVGGTIVIPNLPTIVNVATSRAVNY